MNSYSLQLCPLGGYISIGTELRVYNVQIAHVAESRKPASVQNILDVFLKWVLRLN